jgi:periplasmic divalent cation tolerance protein
MPHLIYATTPDFPTAQSIGQVLIEEKLAACANIFPHMHSIYLWENKLQHSDEVVLLIKTSSEALAHAQARITELHPYECPCIMAWEITQGHTPFLHWVDRLGR